MAAYYIFNLILYRVLPAIETKGTVLASGGRLEYRFNSKDYPAAKPTKQTAISLVANTNTVLQLSTRTR